MCCKRRHAVLTTAAYSESNQMRFAVTILAAAILIAVPIAIGITAEIVSLTLPTYAVLAHASAAFPAHSLAAAYSTPLRAPPLAG